MRELHLYIPGDVSLDQLSDLSAVLKNDRTLSAIFNDTLAVGEEDGKSFRALNDRGLVVLSIAKVDVSEDIFLRPISQKSGNGTVITFKEEFCSRLASIGDHYLRLRLSLSGTLSQLFAENFEEATDRLLLSVFARTDSVEFRLNERRNFGESLKKAFPKMYFPEIEAVHYFLIRDISTELIRSHKAYHKVRRLEPDLWDEYTGSVGRITPSRMMIYHWKSGDSSHKVDDFIALAIFRTPRHSMKLFLFGIILIGALGSELQALLAWVYQYAVSWIPGREERPFKTAQLLWYSYVTTSPGPHLYELVEYLVIGALLISVFFLLYLRAKRTNGERRPNERDAWPCKIRKAASLFKIRGGFR